MKHIYIFACTLLCFPVLAKTIPHSSGVATCPVPDFVRTDDYPPTFVLFSAPMKTDSVPCYDRFEADMMLAGVAFVKNAVFAAGTPGFIRCGRQWGAKVARLEKQFQSCLQTRYPGAVYKKD